MAYGTGFFHDTEIAMLEHELVGESHPMEMDMTNENWMYYYSGIHDMAQKIIDRIHNKEGF